MSDDFHPFLIQRLKKPLEECTISGIFPSPSRKLAIANVMRFDYMGSSEFEGGELKDALAGYAKYVGQNKIQAQTVSVECLRPDRPILPPEKKAMLPESKNVRIYLLAPKKLMDKATIFMKELAQGDPWLQERSYFRESIFAEDISNLSGHPIGQSTVGWFDIKNLFFFFRDKEMFDNMTIISGLKPPPAPHSKPRDASAGPA